jgi:tetratricopeptide repeat protein
MMRSVPRPAHHTAFLASTVALFVVARTVLEWSPGARCWGLDYARYLSPAWRWAPWGVALALVTVASVPPARVALTRRLRPLANRPLAIAALVAFTCGAVCLAFPELTRFTGDFALRRSAVDGIADFDRLFPQASALDRFLHWVLPRATASATGLPLGMVARAQGAVSAAVFGALAAAFGRRSGAHPLPRLVATATVIGSAALGLFTGYDKSLAELSVVTLAFAVAGLGELARGRPGWTSGLMVALAVALHRSGLALVPAWILLWIWGSGARTSAAARRPARARGARPWLRVAPAALIAAQLPHAWSVSRAVDGRHLAPTGLSHMLAAGVDPARLWALANLVPFLVPLLPIVLALTGFDRERPVTWLGGLAASLVVPMLVIHPVQGEFRDWDDFAAVSVAVALPLALLLARGCAKTPATVTTALIAAALVPRLQWLVLESRPERALARIEAWAKGPPAPRRTVAASTLEFVAISHYREKRVEDGRRAMAAAIAQVPLERLYLGWANAEAHAGNWARAAELYEDTARRFPLDPAPWLMLAQAAFQHGDRPAATRAVAALRRLAPNDPWTARAEAALGTMRGGPPGR